MMSEAQPDLPAHTPGTQHEGSQVQRPHDEILTLQGDLELAADALALASHLAQDSGIAISCVVARCALRDSRRRTGDQGEPDDQGSPSAGA